MFPNIKFGHSLFGLSLLAFTFLKEFERIKKSLWGFFYFYKFKKLRSNFTLNH